MRNDKKGAAAISARLPQKVKSCSTKTTYHSLGRKRTIYQGGGEDNDGHRLQCVVFPFIPNVDKGRRKKDLVRLVAGLSRRHHRSQWCRRQ